MPYCRPSFFAVDLRVRFFAFCMLFTMVACGDGASRADTVAVDTLSVSRDSATSPAWTVSFRGYGPLRVGMTLAEAQAAAGTTLSLPPQTEPEQCDYAVWSGAPHGVHLMFEGGVLRRVDVDSSSVATAEGLRVGDAAARAVSLYGTRAIRRPHKYETGEYFIVLADPVADTVHRLVVEVTRDTVRAWRVGQIPQVEYVEGCS